LAGTFHLFNRTAVALATTALLALAMTQSSGSNAINGLTGTVTNVVVAVPAAERIHKLADSQVPQDLDLKRMAEWAMNYLIETPRKHLNYEPVFQCHPLRCPPSPEGQDPVVSCDTDARLDWEWYYMREISGSREGREVEAAFHKRMRDYIDPQGRVWSAPGAYNEANINTKYARSDYVIHIWGATKILKSLSEDYARTKDPQSKALARKVMLALEKIATWDDQGRCWLKCGMGALRADGSTVPNGWNAQPAPLVEPLVTYYLATHDPEGLKFARAYAEGMIGNCQPDGIRFHPDGSVTSGIASPPHSHATMHAVWGVAHLGVVTGNPRYINFARGVWDWMLKRGTGTGWFPAGPDNCNETCCISDMMSIAGLIGRAGYPDYYDCLERYLRNPISNLQFVMTPDFETYYRECNASSSPEAVAAGLATLRKFQGGIIGGSGLNDYENKLLGGAAGFEMFGCCAPEGMRAIYTTWTSTIDRLPKSPAGPAGVYVNLSFTRPSKWGQVVSFMPESGRLTVKAAVRDTFFLRPPGWAPKDAVRAFVGEQPVPVIWSGSYVSFRARKGDELTITYPLLRFTHEVRGLWSGPARDLRMTFEWLGNMVVSASPPGGHTPLFTGKPRVLPPAPAAGP
jgi:hypothetical protein